MRRLAVALGTLLVMAAGASAAQAAECDVTYTALGGRWSEAGNWQGGNVPTAAQNVCIPAGHGTVEVPFDYAAQARSVMAESQLFIGLSAELTLSDPSGGEPDASHFTDLHIQGGRLSSAGSWMDFAGSTNIGGSVGVVKLPLTSQLARLTTGTVSGNATFGIPVLNEGADVEPGGAETLGFAGFYAGYTQTEGGTLTVDLRGPKESDRLQTGAETQIGGAVDVRPIPPFSPKLGETWTLNTTTAMTFQDPLLSPPGYRVFSPGPKETVLELIEAEGPPPAVTRLSAKTGPATGGTIVTITGTNFTRSSIVRFGPTAASSVVVNSTTSITATSPPGTTGATEVSVQTPNGQSAVTKKARFTYEAPTVTGVTPATGPVSGGTSLTVTGSGFAVGTSTIFKFGKHPGTGVTCASTTECTVVSPPASVPGTVDVRATVAKKTSGTGAADRFTYTG